MLFPRRNFGIVADNTNQRVSIFDTDTLQLLQHVPLGADAIDVAMTRDCRRAVVSSFNSKTMFQIDLSGESAVVSGSATTNTFLEDVALTPDGRYAVSVDGSAQNQNIVSYSLRENEFVSAMPANAQAVAVSPTGNGLVLTAVENANSVHRYTIGRCGCLIDTGQEPPACSGPINVNFSSDGTFAFTSCHIPGDISILSTLLPDQITLLDTAATNSPQSMAISSDSRHLFVLGSTVVSIYSFDPMSGHLAFQRSFEHGLSIYPFYGADQIALDPSETRLFISAIGDLAVFTTYGLPLGSVAGVSGPGGLAIGSVTRRVVTDTDLRSQRITLLDLMRLKPLSPAE